MRPSAKSEQHEAPRGEHNHVTVLAPVCKTASKGSLRQGGMWVPNLFSCARGLPCYWWMLTATSERKTAKLWISCLERENIVEQWKWGICLHVHYKHLYRQNKVITVLEHVGAVFVPVPLLCQWRGAESGGFERQAPVSAQGTKHSQVRNMSPAVAKSRCEAASRDVL